MTTIYAILTQKNRVVYLEKKGGWIGGLSLEFVLKVLGVEWQQSMLF